MQHTSQRPQPRRYNFRLQGEPFQKMKAQNLEESNPERELINKPKIERSLAFSFLIFSPYLVQNKMGSYLFNLIMNSIFSTHWYIGLLLAILFLLPGYSMGQNQQTPYQTDSAAVADSVDMRTQMILEGLLEKLEEQQIDQKTAVDLEIDGLIVDNSVTKMGRDFYDLFMSQWEAPQGAKNYTITIRELPAMGISSIVIVEINDQQILELPLQPRYDVIEELAGYAVGSCYQYLENYEQIQQELSGEDMSGSGIY